MTLSEIIDSVRSGGRPDYEDLRYAICAMEALATFDYIALTRLARAELEGRKPFLVTSSVWQLEEHLRRTSLAAARPPKDYVGWNNDPDNPESIERRRRSLSIVNRASSGSNN